MRKSTVDALAVLDAWEKSYKRYRWIKNIWWDFIDAYCMPNSPVDSSDVPEVERIKNKIDAWLDKAQSKWDQSEGAAFEIHKRYRRNKAIKTRFEEIARYIAIHEGFIGE